MFKLFLLLTIISIVGSDNNLNNLLQLLGNSELTTRQIEIHQNIILKNNLPGSEADLILPEECTRNSDCFLIPYSICSLRKCTCKQNYIFSNGQCLALLKEACEVDSECAVPHSICQSGLCQCKTNFHSQDITKCQQVPGLVPEVPQKKLGSNCSKDLECPRTSVCLGTCQCLETHYAKDNHCFEFATRLRFPVHSSEACQYLENSVYTSGSCQCASTYVERNGKCLGKVGTICSEDFECARPSICRGTCQCQATHYSRDGLCYNKLHSNCTNDDQCQVPFSECTSGECKCKKGYAEHENRCYGIKNATCNLPNDCAFTIVTCKSGTCSEVLKPVQGEFMSSKPETTAIWQPYLDVWKNPERHDHHLGEPGHIPGPEKAGNLAWVRNFTLDRVILMRYWNFTSYPTFVTIFCRAKNSTGQFITGTVEIPGDGKCKVDHSGQKFSTDDWATLVDLGPI